MTLILQGIALNEQPMSRPLIGRFDERGGTLGRSDTVTFTLPDPERMISRVQAQVLHRDEGYWIENISAANPILHNGRALSAGMRILLREGDELRIGGYTFRAAFHEDEATATILRGRTVIAHHATDPGRESSSPMSVPEVGNADTLRWAPGFTPAPGASVPTAVTGESTAGPRSALESVLDRFDPVKFEASLGTQSVFDRLRPARRKARLWELYREHFRSLRREVLTRSQ